MTWNSRNWPAPDVRFHQNYAVEESSGCWLWRRFLNEDGYGHIRVNGKTVGVHRFSYELAIGAIPPATEIDHLCRVRHCVNPEHLEAVTHRENVRRSPSGAAKTHCVNGHLFDDVNTLWGTGRWGPRRTCRTCARAADRRRVERRLVAGLPAGRRKGEAA